MRVIPAIKDSSSGTMFGRVLCLGLGSTDAGDRRCCSELLASPSLHCALGTADSGDISCVTVASYHVPSSVRTVHQMILRTLTHDVIHEESRTVAVP